MNRRRTSAHVHAHDSARSVKRQRPRRRRTSARAPSAAFNELRARIGHSIDRWAERTSERAAQPGMPLIGLDVARPPRRLRTGSWAPVVAAAVVAAMFLVVLRMDVIRLRFTLAQSFEEELRLEELKRELTVEMRRLRDPAVLARRAREMGFQRAEHLIDLVESEPARPLPPRAAVSGAIELASASNDRRPDRSR